MARRLSGSPRPYRRRRTSGWAIAIVVIILLAARYLPRQDADRPGQAVDSAAPTVRDAPIDPSVPGQFYRVERVVDGDTLKLANGERVRLIGVNTPESVAEDRPVEPLGPESSLFTKKMVDGKTVELRFDKERLDQYGRTLAYVYVDGVLLNEELIRAGYSRAQLQYPYSNAMKKRFRQAEDEAKAAGRGLWGLPQP